MHEERTDIDVAGVARRVLEGRQPGEDLDQTLLRICKEMHRDRGVMVFEAMHTLLQMQATQPGAPPEQALQQLAEGRAGVQLRQPGESVVVSAGSVKSLDELPPELRKRVEELLASGTTSGHSVVLSAGPGKPLDELPPEVREQVEKALAGGAASGQVVVGGPSVSVTRKVTVRGPGGMEAGKTRCVNCGFESDAPFEACPQCGQARRRSWWRRLFGD